MGSDRTVVVDEVLMPERCIAVGGSAGSIEVLRDLLSVLPPDLSAPMLVVVHVPSDAPSQLARVLGRSSRLPVAFATDGIPARDGTVYVAPPDRHLVLHDGHLRLHRGSRHNRHRPSIDPLFSSVGRGVRGGALGLILSGAPGDGVAGAREVALLGGTILVHDPAEALFPGMPQRVLEQVACARSVPADELASAIVETLARSTAR